MGDDELEPLPGDIPTNFLLMRTRRRRSWTFILALAAVAGVAGAFLWYYLAHS